MAYQDIPPGKNSIQFFHEKIFAPLYSLVFLANFDTFAAWRVKITFEDD